MLREKDNIMFFFSSTIVGGAETNILKISRELVSRGYKVFWSVLEDDGPLRKSIDFDLSGFIETGSFLRSPLKSFRIYKRFVRENKIAIVFNFGLRVELFSRLVSKRLGIRGIVSNIRSTDDWRTRMHTFLDNITCSTVDIWVSNSLAGREAFHVRERIELEKIEVIYNFFEPSPVILPLINLATVQKLRIGILANITQEKGYLDLIPIAQQLDEQNIDFIFVYAGADKLEGEFEKRVMAAGLENRFEYLGYVSNKFQFFEKIDLFILPSYLEGMPTVILEAMAYNKPVISTFVGGIPEVISHGVNGFLCHSGDVECFVKSIKGMHTPKSVEFVVRSAEKLSEFSKEMIIQKWINLIDRVLYGFKTE